MKKRVLSLLLVLVTVLALCAAAAGQIEAQPGYVTDRAQLLGVYFLAVFFCICHFHRPPNGFYQLTILYAE